MRIKPPCNAQPCDRPQSAKGFCAVHYQRWHKYGDPYVVKINRGNRTPRPKPERMTCRACGVEKPRAEFPPNRRRCKTCSSAYKIQWRKDNPDKFAVHQANGEARRLRYELRRRAIRNGLDPDLVLAYYDAHDGRCEICGEPPREGGRDLNMDHDHESGEFRGMLCGNCNAGLGRFKDDPARLESAIMYLKRHAKPAPPSVDGA
jgi:hypothetical protein